MTKDKIRAEETARVTDRVLEEIGIDAPAPPPLRLLKNLIEDVAQEMGIELTEHEVNYIAKTNIAWVFDDINENLARYGAKLRREKNKKTIH